MREPRGELFAVRGELFAVRAHRGTICCQRGLFSLRGNYSLRGELFAGRGELFAVREELFAFSLKRVSNLLEINNFCIRRQGWFSFQQITFFQFEDGTWALPDRDVTI
jgi:hypothetical protein